MHLQGRYARQPHYKAKIRNGSEKRLIFFFNCFLSFSLFRVPEDWDIIENATRESRLKMVTEKDELKT